MNNMEKQFDAIVFDLGGVIVRYRGAPKILEWTRGRWTLPRLWEWWLASELVRDYETGRISSQAFAEGIVREFDLPVEPAEYLASFALGHEAVYEGAPELLRSLAEKYVVAALSNTNETLWKRCGELGILSYFHYLFPSHRIGYVKPDPRIYEHVLRALGTRPERVLFLDDNRGNVAAAAALGIRAVQARGIAEVALKLGELSVYDGAALKRGA